MRVNFDSTIQDFFQFDDVEIDYDLKMWEIGRITSAAFPFFETYKNIPGFEFMDGGFTYNNPSYLTIKYLEEIAKVDLKNVFMLSLGCNQDFPSFSLKIDFLKKSVFHVRSEILSNLVGLNDNMNNSTYHAIVLSDAYLKKRHIRLAPIRMKDISLDGVDNETICELQY